MASSRVNMKYIQAVSTMVGNFKRGVGGGEGEAQ
jgi:hypothetical protein